MTFLADKDAPVLEFNTSDTLDMAYAKEKLKNVRVRNEEIQKLQEQLDKVTKDNLEDLRLIARVLCPLDIGDIVAPGAGWEEGKKYWEYVVTSIHPVLPEDGRMAKHSAGASPFGVGVAVRIVKLKKSNRRVAKYGTDVLYLGLSTCNRVGVYEGDLEADLREQDMFDRAQTLEEIPYKKRIRSRAADVFS